MGIEGRLCGNYRDIASYASRDVGRDASRDVGRDASRDVGRDASRDVGRDASRDAGRVQNDRPSNIFSNLFQSFFEPILIFPTASQIELATRRVLYRDIVSPINNSCPISMDNFNDNETVTIIRHCGHIFNSDELTTWFQSNSRCPVCRYDIRNFNINTSSISNQERSSSINDFIHDISGNIFYPEDASGNSIQW
jgi:hypothetical protein